jgi:ankyrin repeat and BTB/POZ domain-containing protein 1
MSCSKLMITFSIRYYLSERFRLRFEDAGLEDMLEESTEAAIAASKDRLQGDTEQTADEGIDIHGATPPKGENPELALDLEATAGVIRTLDGEEIDDEFAQDAMNYQILLGKIDRLLDQLRLDA